MNSTSSCWNGAAVARNHGIQIVGYGSDTGWSSCGSSNCVSEGSVGKVCIVFDKYASVECTWSGGSYSTPTVAKYTGGVAVWSCNKQPGQVIAVKMAGRAALNLAIKMFGVSFDAFAIV